MTLMSRSKDTQPQNLEVVAERFVGALLSEKNQSRSRFPRRLGLAETFILQHRKSVTDRECWLRCRSPETLKRHRHTIAELYAGSIGYNAMNAFLSQLNSFAWRKGRNLGECHHG